MNRIPNRWKRYYFFGLLLGILLVTSGVGWGQEPQVLVTLERDRIFEGESVGYSVLLNHCEDSARPDMPQAPELQFRHAGVTVMRQTTFDGFRRISIGGPRHEYILTPQASGELTIPAPSVTVAGKTYRGEALKLRVVPPNEQDLAILELSSDRQNVYPLQPFQVQLTVALKALPVPHTDKDPLRGVGTLPLLTIPWADDQSLPSGVTPETPVQRWVQAYMAEGRRPIGFGINELRLPGGLQFGFSGPGFGGLAGDPFSMLSDPQRAIFHPQPKRTKRKDSHGLTVDYWEYRFERTFTADKVGLLTFGPVTLKGSFASRVLSGGDVRVEDVYAIAKPVNVEVRGAPPAGRPDSYIGAIGRFEIDAELSPTTVKVGDPMTLSLRMSGSGSLSEATAPKLDQLPEVADAFKVYQASEESSDGERRFRYGLRPKKAGIREFPPIDVAYFDYEQEKYVTLRTDPIPIEVAESDRLAAQDIAMAAGSLPTSSNIEASSEGIFANITDPRRVRDQRVRPEAWLLSLISMAGVFVVCVVVSRQWERRRNDPAHLRRRAAAKKAQRAIEESRRLLQAGSMREAIEGLSSAVTGLVADALGRAEAALTAKEVVRELTALGLSPDIVTRCQLLLDEFDAARYGEGFHRVEDQVAAADRLITDLIREFRQRKLAL